MAATAPPSLKKGDLVLLIATARKVSPAEMTPAIKILESWGLRVETGPSLYQSHHQFAGDDAARAQDLQSALDHPTAKAIVIARGGYGTLRIIDRVDFSGFRRHTKWIAGYSDVTILHCAALQHGFQSLHATMPINFEIHAEATDSLRRLLFGETVTYDIAVHPLNRAGRCEGDLVGGNLSLLYALKGTPFFPDLSGKILFLEDLDEYLYHIDRMVLSLKRAGCFEKLAGVVVGGFTDMRDNTVPFGKSAEEIVAEHLAGYDFPVCFNFPAGHIDGNFGFRYGARVRLAVESRSVRLEYL